MWEFWQMMRYRLLKRNTSTTARTDEEFVRWMRKQDIAFFPDNESFMHAYAHRKETFEKIDLRSECVAHFVEDLERHQLLEKLPIHRRKFVFF